mmetsp:Transcript_17443/g.50961  ORF Transcript_17443/g.50961 Transcript_17443/m.50961 type:complete len:195 (-) Transcript_17443:567-1151(-)
MSAEFGAATAPPPEDQILPPKSSESRASAAVRIQSITVSSFTIKQHPSSSVAVYEILVEALPGSTRWKVHRRFRDFRALHAKLGATRHGRALPSLPPRTLVGNLSQGLLEARRAALQEYLSGLLRNPGVSSSHEFLDFVGAAGILPEEEASFGSQGDPLTSFPYTHRSGRYGIKSQPQTKRSRETTQCLSCTVG